MTDENLMDFLERRFNDNDYLTPVEQEKLRDRIADLSRALISDRDQIKVEAERLRGFYLASLKTVADLDVERDALKAQLDSMTTEERWRRIDVRGGKIVQTATAVREQRLVGPWVEVTD
ncbi:hypothetical protein ACFVU2_20995 [Leifsonia sp. NPDC058194]|uniref:hypothetical protein n=1 Tax=Leifsonia sp. NPDC058194 TaxID=3346374 RepID=UPI0036DCBB80